MGAPVRLNVYNMYWLNEYAHTFGFGVYHSGVEVYGVEYAYGGHQFPFSGIFTNSPQDAEELGETFQFKESIVLGETALSKKSVDKLIKSLGDEYRGDRYHLISRNCNHFAAFLSRELTGIDNFPGWVNRLASLTGSIPFLGKIVPMEWLTPMALEQTLENDGLVVDKTAPVTLNYPSNGGAVDRGIDALTFCNDSLETNRKNTNAQAATSNGTSNGSTTTTSWFRRTSATVQSAPNSSRSNGSGSNTPTLTRLWNSIKNIAPEDQVVAPNSRFYN